MSEDIQRIVAAELRKSGDDAQGSQLPTFSFPSPGHIPSKPKRCSGGSYMRHCGASRSDNDTVHVYNNTGDEPQHGPGVLRHSLALDPPAYTGSAELRGETANTVAPLQQQVRFRGRGMVKYRYGCLVRIHRVQFIYYYGGT